MIRVITPFMYFAYHLLVVEFSEVLYSKPEQGYEFKTTCKSRNCSTPIKDSVTIGHYH